MKPTICANCSTATVDLTLHRRWCPATNVGKIAAARLDEAKADESVLMDEDTFWKGLST